MLGFYISKYLEISCLCVYRITNYLKLLFGMKFVEYFFVSREEMQKAIENNEFVEHAEFSGNMYGTRCENSKKFSIIILKKLLSALG